MIGRPPENPWLNFFKYVRIDPTDCWLWTGSLTHNGYPRFTFKRKSVRAHRWLWERWKGPIPAHLTLDHLCNTPACVNPDHLKVATIKENVLRGRSFVARNARKTHCPYGHPFAGDNLFMEGSRRRCRACNNKRKLAYYHRKAAERREKVGDTLS